MIKPSENSAPRFRAPLALVALIAILVLPSAAVAQDPAADQYAPTAPTGGGNVPTSPTDDPVPTAGAGDPGGLDTSSGGTGNGDSASPTDSAAPADASTAATATQAAEGDNKAQRTVDKLAIGAQQSRDAAGSATSQPVAELLRTDNSSGSGMGIFLWVVLGATLLWAIASGVATFRRRDRDDAGGRNQSSQPA